MQEEGLFPFASFRMGACIKGELNRGRGLHANYFTTYQHVTIFEYLVTAMNYYCFKKNMCTSLQPYGSKSESSIMAK